MEYTSHINVKRTLFGHIIIHIDKCSQCITLMHISDLMWTNPYSKKKIYRGALGSKKQNDIK